MWPDLTFAQSCLTTLGYGRASLTNLPILQCHQFMPAARVRQEHVWLQQRKHRPVSPTETNKKTRCYSRLRILPFFTTDHPLRGLHTVGPTSLQSKTPSFVTVLQDAQTYVIHGARGVSGRHDIEFVVVLLGWECIDTRSKGWDLLDVRGTRSILCRQRAERASDGS